MVEISIAYQGSLRCVAKHGPSASTLTTDAPVDNQGKGEAFSPTDLVATALGTCILTIMGIVAQRRGLAIEGTAVTVKKEMVAQPIRRIGRLTVDIRVPTVLSAEDQERMQHAARTCPVHQSLHPDVQVIVNFHYGM